MDYMMFMQELLKEELTKESYELLDAVISEILPVWKRPASSGGKYHLKEDGSVPSIAEHTAEMLLAAVKTARMFHGCERKCTKKDVLLIAIVLHDSMKYGLDPTHAKHTVRNHDKLAADFVRDLDGVFESVLGEENTKLLEDCIRYHSGRWSTGFNLVKDEKFDDMVFFVHALDMLSTSDNLKMTHKQILHYWPQALEDDDIPF